MDILERVLGRGIDLRRLRESSPSHQAHVLEASDESVRGSRVLLSKSRMRAGKIPAVPGKKVAGGLAPRGIGATLTTISVAAFLIYVAKFMPYVAELTRYAEEFMGCAAET
jgi:hypothetical protein